MLPNATMSLSLFESVNKQLKPYTKELAYHVVGDPLVLGNLEEYLNISLKQGLKVNITTTGNSLKAKDFPMLLNKSIRQINFSINSYHANSHKKTLQEYLEPIFLFTQYVLEQKKELFINFRLWNLDEKQSAKEFNEAVFEYTNEFFQTQFNLEEIYAQKPKNLRVVRKVFFHFDEYFEWPTMQNPIKEEKGYCYGLNSHFGILSSGVVVPCCLDKDGIVNLGNVNEKTLEDILNSKRAKNIQDGFLNHIATEELCQRCEYKTRFNTRIENE